VKNSDINVTRVANLGVRQYGFLEAYFNIIKDNNYSVSVVGASFYDDVSSYLKEVYLKKYTNGQLVGEEKLVPNNTNEPGEPTREHAFRFHTKPSDDKFDYTSLKIKAIYSDGATFEKEIYYK